MAKKTNAIKLWLAIGCCLVCVISYSDVFAGAGDRDRDRGRSHNREVVVVGHDRYHYRNGWFYRPSWFGFEFAVSIPPKGAIVGSLPFGYTTITVGGIPYYYCNRAYYRPCSYGYIVVPEPTIPSSRAVVYAQGSAAEVVTINVPNANGSFTPVTLVKMNNGYMGPQGEYYQGHPTVDQLRVLYGR